ncbi:hypothetical protein C8E04_2553 [Rhodococcus globerulus]|nr:hypothetical protein C8E04_2553 [Rhodococcus globerulus]
MGNLRSVSVRLANQRGRVEDHPTDSAVDGDRDSPGRDFGCDEVVTQPCPQDSRLGVSLDFSWHARVRPIGVLGAVSVDLQEPRSRYPVCASVRAHRSTGNPGGVPFCRHRVGIERSCLHGGNRPSRSEFGQRGTDRSIHRVGHDVEPDHAPNGSPTGNARDYPADGQRVDQHAQDDVAGVRSSVQLGVVRSCQRYFGCKLRADSTAHGCGNLVPRDHQPADDRPVLRRAVLLEGCHASTDHTPASGACRCTRQRDGSGDTPGGERK